MPAAVNILGPLEPDALRILERIPDISAIPTAPHRPGQADIVVQFADSEYPIFIEVKNRGNAPAAWQMIHYLEALPGSHGVLIADETTAEARSILREHGIGLVDGLGNAHLELPGLVLHLEAKRTASQTRRVRLSGKAGVAAQALLIDRRRQWRVTELAKLADVSPALAHRVLARLDREGITRTEGAGPRQIRVVDDRSALLDLWAEEEDPKIAGRIPLFILGQTERQRMSKVATALELGQLNYAITGAAAAALSAPFVTAVPVVEAWVSGSATIDQILAATESTAVSEGANVVLLQSKDDTPLAFSQKTEMGRIANTFRTYVDLRRDPRRGAEQAEHLREEVIGF